MERGEVRGEEGEEDGGVRKSRTEEEEVSCVKLYSLNNEKHLCA